ncbi:MAG: (2Fe-2S)-binding protein [Coprothermobacterota bacterium]|nr:(2Fe-2S)-binding protein [Coprothermobacterota bacterium]
MEALSIQIKVNGHSHRLQTFPNRRLLDILREDLTLTGTKEGCGIGECGACTVLVDGEAVNACLILAPQVDGREILTIEGLSERGSLHPLQQAFIDHFAFQCGFCTPGMLMAAKALLDVNPSPSREEIRQGLAGVLCRCTGYIQIFEAVEDAAQALLETAVSGIEGTAGAAIAQRTEEAR